MLLNCGHTVCQKCVDKLVATRRNEANAGPERSGNCVECPVCDRETEIPPDGLTTNYNLYGMAPTYEEEWIKKGLGDPYNFRTLHLVDRARKPLVDACACSCCGKRSHVADMFSCDTCQEMLHKRKPIWICTRCALKQHREHALSEWNTATRQQIEDARQGLVSSSHSKLGDACACNGCRKQPPAADMFTCETCQEALNKKPIWICALCAMRQHRYHKTSDCNKATQQQIQEACRGIASGNSLAFTYINRTKSRLNAALDTTELIAQLQNRGFSGLEERIRSVGRNFTQEDLVASLHTANYLMQKLAQASVVANEAVKGLESVLQDCREMLEETFPEEREKDALETEDSETSDEDEPTESEDSGKPEEEKPAETDDVGTSHNNFEFSAFDGGQEKIEFADPHRRLDVIPDLSRFTLLQVLSFRGNRLTSINDNMNHATLTELDLHDNQITEIRGLDALVNLEVLNVSYNRLKRIEGLANLVKLKHICLAHNKIEKLEGLDNQHDLRELRLCMNEICKIENISQLSKLRVLSIWGNRLTKLENLDTLVDLEELHVDQQEIESFDGIQKLTKLKRIDADQNSIASLDHLGNLQQLQTLYLKHNKISEWSEVKKLTKLAKLETVTLEGNPIETEDRANFFRKADLSLQRGVQCRLL